MKENNKNLKNKANRSNTPGNQAGKHKSNTNQKRIIGYPEAIWSRYYR